MRAVIVSHGQPGDPGPQQQAIEFLADQVRAEAPNCEVTGATLAAPGALAAALTPGCCVYPMFMAEGWFTGRELPRRIAEIGIRARILPPFGSDPGLPALVRDILRAALDGRAAGDVAVLLAAHGSQRSQASFGATEAMAARLRPEFPVMVTGYVEQKPFLADAARDLGTGICLPMFALRAEHVTDDLPQALDTAGFRGTLLDPVGLHPAVPGMIAAALRRAAAAPADD